MANEIKLTVSYDGTDFCGWQRQNGFRTVQEEIEKALSKMHGHSVSLTGAGRTDSGVHAVGQVCNFSSDIKNIPPQNFEYALNSLLPRDVRIVHSEKTIDGFSSRFDAKYRRYKYFIRCSVPQMPHLDRYAWHLFRKPNIVLLNRLAACLHGEINCTTFAAASDQSNSKNRYIYHAVFYIENDYLVFDIKANAFLQKMVRSITGTLIELESKQCNEDQMKKILCSCDRKMAGLTAPPQGLFLWNVGY